MPRMSRAKNPMFIYHIEYPFSSMGIYLGLRKDHLGLVDTGFILGLFHNSDRDKAVQEYAEFVFKQKDLATDKSIQKCLERMSVNEYRSERRIVLREYKPLDILAYIGKQLDISTPECIYLKSKRAHLKFRAYSAFVLRTLGGLCYKEICKVIGNISLSGSSRLCSRGYELMNESSQYRQIYNSLLESGIPA